MTIVRTKRWRKLVSQSKTFHNAPRKNDPDINIWSATATNLFSSCLHKTKQILLLQQYNTNKMYSSYNLQLLDVVHTGLLTIYQQVTWVCWIRIIYMLWDNFSERQEGSNVYSEIYDIFILFLQCFDTVGWVIWPEKTRPHMTYNVLVGR